MHEREIKTAPEAVIERLSEVFVTQWTQDQGD